MSERPTFSPFWHRVRSMRPRLRPHVQITRQHYRGRRWHVVHDPASNQFYRLNPIAHDLVCMLDGRRTVDEVWQISLQKFADAAPTQNEVIELISQLYSANLLSVDSTPETEQLLRRGRDRLKRKAMQQAIGIMYFKIRVFNPDRMLTALEPLFRPLLSLWGLAAWAALVITALMMVLPEWDRLAGGFDSALAPANWPWLAVVFIVTKAIHELGHGLLCKRFGGQVPEFGFMLLVLFPAPFVDASSCWAFANKWKRIAVGAGGMIFELAVASVCALVWLGAPDGSLQKQICYNAMLMASLSTVLFNGNPLMKFDAYYILSDLIEVPNLMQRSFKMLGYLFQKHMYRVENPQAPSTDRTEQGILVTYGIAALAYRIFLFFSITLYVMGKLFAMGLVLAIWTAAMWFIMPVGKFVHWLATNNKLADKRAYAIGVTLGAIALVAGGLGLVPAPDYRRGNGVVECAVRSGVFAGVDGFVTIVHVRPGDTVAQGAPILTLESPELLARERQYEATLAELEAGLRAATLGDGQPAVAQQYREKIEVLSEALADTRRRIELLVVRAPHAGVVVGDDPQTLAGAFVRRGSPVCEVVDPATARIAAMMDQRQASWLFELPPEDYPVKVRLISALSDEPMPARIEEVIDAGQVRLAHAALGYAGGGQLETDPQDRGGLIARRPSFLVHLAPAPGAEHDYLGTPGERVRLRFRLPDKPLLAQWIDRMHKLVQGRVNI